MFGFIFKSGLQLLPIFASSPPVKSQIDPNTIKKRHFNNLLDNKKRKKKKKKEKPNQKWCFFFFEREWTIIQTETDYKLDEPAEQDR